MLIRKEQVTQKYLTAPIVDIYCRVSTEDQEDNTSLDTQEAECRKYAKENGFVVGLVHSEVAGGFTLDRDKLKLLQSRYAHGIIQGVVVYKLSRLARKHAFISYLMVEMELANCTLYSVKEKIEKDEQGEIKIFLEGFFAQRERNEIVDRTKTGRYASVVGGDVAVGRRPLYGYTWIEGEKKTRRKFQKKVGFTLNNQSPFADRDLSPSAVVRMVFCWFDEGRSLLWIMHELVRLEVPPPEKVWHPSTIKRILSNIRYTGTGAKMFCSTDPRSKYRISDEPVDLPDGLYPKLIEMDLYQRVQERLERNAHEAASNSKHPEQFLLRGGFVICGECGKIMIGENDVRCVEYARYICRARRDCPKDLRQTHFMSIRAAYLDEQVWGLVEQFAHQVKLIQEAIKAASREDLTAFRLNALNESIKRHQKAIDGYQKDLKEGIVPEKLRPMTYEEIEKETNNIEDLRERLSELQSQAVASEQMQKEYKKIEIWCERIRSGKTPEADEELSYDEKRTFMRLIGVRVIVHQLPPHKGKKVDENERYEFGIELPKIQELAGLGQDQEVSGQEECNEHLRGSRGSRARAFPFAQRLDDCIAKRLPRVSKPGRVVILSIL